MTNRFKPRLPVYVAVALMVSMHAASAQTWPAKAIRCIIPTAPGGGCA